MTNQRTERKQGIGLHVYVYCWLAILISAALCLFGAAQLVTDFDRPSSIAVLGVFATPIAFLIVLGLSLRRCSAADLSGPRALLFMTAYMTIGIGGFSMIFAIPATMFAILAAICIAAASLFKSDAGFAPRQFRRLVLAYQRHRMYQ